MPPPADPIPGWFAALSDARLESGTPPPISAVCHDSRRVTAGALFVAVPGLTADGHAFIGQALAAGATALVVQDSHRAAWSPFADGGATFVVVPDSRVALAQAAAGFYGHPARQLGTVGVTGTDGKTTTTHLIAHVLTRCGLRAGHLSSVEFSDGATATLNASHMTTLEAPDVQAQLARIRDAGARYAVVEASSHGLDMHRVDECEFDVGVFTNLTSDHLDYHGTLEAYRDAKAKLFRMLDAAVDKGVTKAAVLNADDPASRYMASCTGRRQIWYGLRGEAGVRGLDIMADGFGSRFTVSHGAENVAVRTRLLGEYNVANCLAAVAVAVSQGAAVPDAARALESFPGVPGRMELIEAGRPFRVVVDIASTEQAMRNVLSMLRPLTPGRLVVLFGAAGERDVERRHGLARAVAQYADAAVIANEDPRSEDPEAIIDEIATALAAAGFDESRIARIADRRTAMAAAFESRGEGDTVLLAGKGTEQSIVIGTTHHPWDERAVARELLRGV
jgi:UDP-N-acetylmuramoyl-L-alanyl-D-glutamate--2,6-diaminopimelate ligase